MPMTTMPALQAFQNLSKGDYVVILAPHQDEGQRGFVLEPKENDSTRLRIVLDDFRFDNPNASFSSYVSLVAQPTLVKVVKRDKLQLIRKDHTMVTTRVSHFITTAYPCHGMATTPFAESMIDPHSAHGIMPRPAACQLLRLPQELCTCQSSEAEHVLRSISGGQFHAHWIHSFQAPNTSQEQQQWMLRTANPLFAAEIIVPSDSTGQATTIKAGRLYCIPRPSKNGTGTVTQYKWKSSYKITEDQDNWIMVRILHHLVRADGCRIGNMCLRELRVVMKEYKRRNRQIDLLDVSAIVADIMVQTKQSAAGCFFGLHGLGHAWEATQEYRLAATIYAHAGTYYATDSSNKRLLLASYHSQGVAYLHDGDFGQAEALLLQGLRELFTTYKKQGYTHEAFDWFCYHLPRMYMKLSILEMCDPSMTDFFAVLLAMLHAAKLGPDEREERSSFMLAAEFHGKDKARKALIKAFQTSSVMEFREAMRSWKAQTAPFSIDWNNPPADKVTESNHDESSSSTTVTEILCSNPNCTLEPMEDPKLLRCSRCKKEVYCSKACQLAHWMAHKPTCTV